jgi:hypothetical protein
VPFEHRFVFFAFARRTHLAASRTSRPAPPRACARGVVVAALPPSTSISECTRARGRKRRRRYSHSGTGTGTGTSSCSCRLTCASCSIFDGLAKLPQARVHQRCRAGTAQHSGAPGGANSCLSRVEQLLSITTMLHPGFGQPLSQSWACYTEH